jgi:hypothetical protein
MVVAVLTTFKTFASALVTVHRLALPAVGTHSTVVEVLLVRGKLPTISFRALIVNL